ncbi:response regulator transcription factor [uncultured Sphingomonas sp.]|uniref:response regulator transcription factor n=1 Tax=uncultured Sphingomonas sp. TaxID=158754 RepID=UPI0035CA2686
MARIIVAEDDEIVAELVRDALIGAGHGVGVLPTGAQALAVIRSRMPDLVILDCNMPEMSGLLVLREMRSNPRLVDLPVLMLTGRRSDKDVSLAMYDGANDYMKKPFDPDELVFRVEQLLPTTARAATR